MMTHPLAKMFEEEPQKFIAALICKLRNHEVGKGLQIRVTHKDLEDTVLISEAMGSNVVVGIKGEEDAIVFMLVDAVTGKQFSEDQTLNEHSSEAQRMARSLEFRERSPAIIASLKAWAESHGCSGAPEVSDALSCIEALT